MKKLVLFFGILVCATKISSAQNNQFDWSIDDVLYSFEKNIKSSDLKSTSSVNF